MYNIKCLGICLLLATLFFAACNQNTSTSKRSSTTEQADTYQEAAKDASTTASKPRPKPAPKSNSVILGERDKVAAESNAPSAPQNQYRYQENKKRHQPVPPPPPPPPPPTNESYADIVENEFKNTMESPLSTFSIDVDKAAYSNMRRFLNNNQLPPKDAVRIEELVNYFSYDYPQPTTEHPFSITTEVAPAPWNPENWLVHVGLQGKEMDMEEAPRNNLVFLLDVSGSMDDPNKLPLLKKSLKLLAGQMRATDKVAIVVYAGAAGVVLPSTSFKKKGKIFKALDNLRAGGSTAGGAGILKAYQIAEKHFIKNGNNRIILATDGDFNVGASSDKAMEELIEEKRKSGIFLTVLGFGMGNYKDSKMEVLADKGNGNYAYIDNLLEAKKVLVKEMTGTLFTIAKDVKIQIEFNPAKIKSYRLIGYENRILKNKDFDDDTKDAGELGAGHTVTALYELVPTKEGEEGNNPNKLKYQQTGVNANALVTNELMTVKFRYKPPKADQSKLIVDTVTDEELGEKSNNFDFSAAVASFGMLLRDSKYKGKSEFDFVANLARKAKGTDEEGDRAEFVKLVEKAELLQ